MTDSSDAPVLLKVDGLAVTFRSAGGDVHAVRSVSFTVRRGEMVAIVGESGSGKTVTALSMLGLVPAHAVRGILDLVVGLRATPTRRREPVTELDTLDGLDSHEGARKPAVETAIPMHVAPQAGRQAVNDDFDDATESVAVFVRGVDLGDHRFAGVGIEATHRVGVEAIEISRRRQHVVRSGRLSDGDDVADHLDVERLLEEMDANEVDKAVLVQRGSIYGFDSSYVCDSAARFPERLAAVCADRGLILLVGADAELARELGAQGVHLPERLAQEAGRLKAEEPGWLITAAAHGAGALVAAAEADAAILSPVFASSSPSAGAPLGVERFSQMVAAAPVPVYALGGVDMKNAPELLGSGACGIAVVSALVRT